MSKATISLDNIAVASPCKASWDDMIGTDQARFCMQCRQHVYDLSGMSKTEAEALVRNKEGGMCVRFYRRPDGKVMTRDCPFGIRVIGRRLAWVLGIAAAIFFVFGAALFAGRSPSAGPGQPGQSAWEIFRNLFAPPPPRPMIMGGLCPAPAPGGKAPAPPMPQ